MTSNRKAMTSSGLLRWQRVGVYGAAGLLTATGAFWLLLRFLLPDGDDRFIDTANLQGNAVFANAPFWSLSLITACKAWLVRFHAAAALWFCVIVGSLLPLHISGAWHRAQNRWSGSVNVATFLVLLVTGYALWYAPEGIFRLSSEWLHWAIGAALPISIWLHVRLGKKSRKAVR